MRARHLVALVVVVLCALWAHAGWLEVSRADGALDLAAAREAALAAITADPTSADAVAAAGWWRDNLEVLADPDAVLSAAPAGGDPELGFLLARVEAELRHRPPVGALPEAELAGPFGVLDTLDLDRGVVPADDALPPPGTRWRGDGSGFRLVLRSLDGWLAPPQPMLESGVYLASYSFTSAAVTGWMVVEARGGFDLEVDGHPVDRRRHCSELAAGVLWYRVRLAAGRHEVRLSISSTDVPQVRLSLYDDAGLPLRLTPPPEASPRNWSGARVETEAPPAEAALTAALGEKGGSVSQLMLAAALARLREDAVTARTWLERATAAAPDAPQSHLALARLFLTLPTGADVDSDRRRCREELGKAGELPLGQLVGQVLSVREGRQQDADDQLDRLVESHPHDPRVLQLWVRTAVARGWAREAEQGLAELQAQLPASPAVLSLRLDVLGSLQRWDERSQLLEATAVADPLAPNAVEKLAGACRLDAALAALAARREVAETPDLDITQVRLLVQAGQRAAAAAALDRAVARWGDLEPLDELRLVLGAWQGEAAENAALDAALARAPANLDLLTLAWRRRRTPFYAPFRVDALERAKAAPAAADGVDAVLLLDQAVERVFADGSSLYYYHGLSKALTPEGARQAAAVQLMAGAELLTVRVIHPDGTIEVPPDVHAADDGLTLRDVGPGDMVEEEYVAAVRGGGPTRGGHVSPYIYRFADSERAFGLSEYVILAPPDVPVQVDGNLEGVEHDEATTADGLRVLRYRAEAVPPIPDEPFAPPQQELLPWVTYGFGVSWQDVGDTVRDRALAMLRGGPDLWRWGAEHLANRTPAAGLAALVSDLVDTVDEGGAALDLRTTAGESLGRRKGNRLGITAAVLLHAGWDVDLVLTRPMPLAGSHLEVPTMDAFGVPLLRVVAPDGSETWLDLEDGRRGLGHIRPMLQGSDGLVLPLSEPTRAVSLLDHLPRFPNPELEEPLRLSGSVAGDGGARLTLRMRMRGASGERLQQMVQGVTDDRAAAVYAHLAGSIFPGAEQVHGSLETQEDGTLLTLELALPQACEPVGAALECRALTLDRPLSPMLASLPQRRFPLVLQLPLDRRLDLDLDLPAGFTVSRKPRLLEAEFGTVKEELKVAAGHLHSVLQVSVPAQVISPERYPDFVRFAHAVDELTSRPLRLEAVP